MIYYSPETSASGSDEMACIAANAIMWHRKHSDACDRMPLAYIDKLMDALLAGKQQTVREVACELLELVPDLSEEQAFCLARTKFLGIGLDSEAV